MPRVISGTAKGRKLFTVPGEGTRPITDRVKEALYDILGPDIFGATMLDLFAGTGGVGIEALSRGADFVRFVEWGKRAAKVVRKNLSHCKLDDPTRAELLQMDAFALLKRKPDRAFDYVYIAPPQYHGLWKKALLMLDEQPDWLAPDGWVIVQIHPSEYEELELRNFAEIDRRDYGSTRLVFYARVGQDE